jgi:hypothetical protein
MWTRQAPHQGGLAGPVLACEGDYFSCPDVEIDTVERPQGSVLDRYLVSGEKRFV